MYIFHDIFGGIKEGSIACRYYSEIVPEIERDSRQRMSGG